MSAWECRYAPFHGYGGLRTSLNVDVRRAKLVGRSDRLEELMADDAGYAAAWLTAGRTDSTSHLHVLIRRTTQIAPESRSAPSSAADHKTLDALASSPLY
jgi:hypothetical protein